MLAALRRLPSLETTLFLVATAVLSAVALYAQRSTTSGPAPESYSSYDADAGGYRAWYELLAREGVRVDRFARRPAFLERSIDTLIWSEPLPFDPRQNQPTRADVAALEAWVRAGGTLLYVGHDDAAARRGILALPATRPARVGTSAPFVAAALSAGGVGRVHSSSPLRWRLPKHPVRVLLADERGPLVLAYALGRGRVTVLVDERLFANDEISRAGRARLALALALPAVPAGVVAFDEAVHGYAVPEHWWAIVPRAFAVALGLAALALLVAFAGAAVRLGPPFVPLERADRSSAEFLTALASLLERGGAARKALADATASSTLAVARTLGVSEASAGNALVARLEPGELRGDFEALLALGGGTALSERDFTRGVALAARIRKDRASHARPSN